MKKLKEFKIPLTNLKEGKNEFKYNINSKFFEAFQYYEFIKAKLKVKLVLVKKPTFLKLDFSAKGTVSIPCDSTGEPFDFDTKGSLSLIIKFGDKYNDDNEEIIVIPHSANQINVAHYIYDMIILSIPMKRVNTKVATNYSESETHKELKYQKIYKKIIDPRWEKLKTLTVNK